MEANLTFLAIALAAMLATAAIAQHEVNPLAEVEAGISLVERAGMKVLPSSDAANPPGELGRQG